VHDEARHRLVGRRWGRTFTMGDPLRVRLAEANAVTGSLLFALVEGTNAAAPKRGQDKAGRGSGPRATRYSERR
jgi:ribonuclease R